MDLDHGLDDDAVVLRAVTPQQIVEQRSLGWPDFHPEDFCHRCGRSNLHAWFSPEWVALTGSNAGILCPQCFAALDPDPNSIWIVTRWQPPDADELARLAEMLGCFMDADHGERERVAGCLLNAGYKRATAEP